MDRAGRSRSTSSSAWLAPRRISSPALPSASRTSSPAFASLSDALSSPSALRHASLDLFRTSRPAPLASALTSSQFMAFKPPVVDRRPVLWLDRPARSLAPPSTETGPVVSPIAVGRLPNDGPGCHEAAIGGDEGYPRLPPRTT